MLTIESFKYGSFKTSAIVINVEFSDPVLAAQLANLVASNFNLWLKTGKAEKFRNEREFLSDTISESQTLLNRAQQKLEIFTLNNANLIGLSLSDINNNSPTSFDSTNFAAVNPDLVPRNTVLSKIRIQIFNLGKAEKFEKKSY